MIIIRRRVFRFQVPRNRTRDLRRGLGFHHQGIDTTRNRFREGRVRVRVRMRSVKKKKRKTRWFVHCIYIYCDLRVLYNNVIE